MFATPSYDKRICYEYTISMVQTMLELERQKISASIAFEAGNCFIDHARNALVNTFMESDATELFMIDSDQGWKTDNVLHLLIRPEPVVAGVVIGREDSGKFHITPTVDENGNAQMREGLLEVDMIGAAFIRIKREVIQKMIDAYPDDFYMNGDKKVYALFKTGPKDGRYYGEDAYFCERWKAIGGSIHILADMNFQHIGRKRYEGNYWDHLKKNYLGEEDGNQAAA